MQRNDTLISLYSISFLCSFYLIFQLGYITHASFSFDEFWFAHHIYQYTKYLPYRDFLPYKTTLGYYLLTPAFFFSHEILQPLYYAKDEIAIINTLALAGTAYWATKFFNPKAVAIALAIVIASHLFLPFSADLRVDILSVWLGLFSVMFILSQRFVLSGIMVACGFMISQKALWFFIASNIALALHWLCITRDWRTLRHIIQFNLAVMLPLLIYLGVWSYFSHPSIVFKSVFLEGYTQSKLTWYTRIYYTNWQFALKSSPLPILLWPCVGLSLLSNSTHSKHRLFIFSYASLLILLFVSFKQPFLYNFVFLVPAFFLLYSEFFSWLFYIFQQPSQLISTRKLFWAVSFCVLYIISISLYLNLPIAYFILILVPIFLGLFLYKKTAFLTALSPSVLILVFFTGFIYPSLWIALVTNIHTNAGYQKSMTVYANDLLKNNDGYFAATPLLYDKDQSIPGLKNLIAPALAWLNQPSPELLSAFLPSLYIVQRTQEKIIRDLQQHPVKLYVNNYRVVGLPSQIRFFLAAHYEHLWGSIYVYSPIILAGKNHFTLSFSGSYLVESGSNVKITLDGKMMSSGEEIFLTKGTHQSLSNKQFRLKFFPENALQLNPLYQDDQWYRMTKF